MKKLIIYTIAPFIFLLYSCKEQESKQDDLEIKMMNDTIFCVKNLNYTKLHYKSKEYDSLYNKLSMNIVRYKIHNNSNKKYFVILNSDFFEQYDEYDWKFPDNENRNLSINRINFSLYSDYKVLGGSAEAPFYSPYLNPNLYEISRENLDTLFYKDTKNKYKINNFSTSYNVNYINKNNFVIYPNETKYFTTIINLPLRNYEYDYISWYTLVEKNKTYQAGLTLYNVAKQIKKYLTPDLKKEIEQNGYTIFDGIIQSNKIPVKMLNMPE